MKSKLIYIILFFAILPFCKGQNTYSYTQPQQLDDGWETTDLKSLNVDTTNIYQLFNYLLNKENKIHSVLLVKNNQIIIEEYFGDNAVDKVHDLRSVSKSIKSLLMGVALEKGFIADVKEPFLKYLPHLKPEKNLDERKYEITFAHLLTMSSGLECNDWDKKSKGQEDKVYKKKDWLQYTLNLPMVNEPGAVSNYCSMGVILLTEAISQASEMDITQFAEDFLFNPLGISNMEWGHTSEKEVINSGKRLYMTSRDMAKMGELVLNKGKWNGEQIISEKWIEEMTTPKTKITGINYGYLWWNIYFNVKGQEIKIILATGNGGQYIMIVPSLEMVVVFTGGAYNSEEDKIPFAIMQDVFLPAFSKK